MTLTEEDFGAADPRCQLTLLLDTSRSMGSDRGNDLPLAIDQLNKGLQALRSDLSQDAAACRRVEILVVQFGDSVSPVGDWQMARDWDPPTLSAEGSTTPMGKAIMTGLRLGTTRRRECQDSGLATYRPWLFLLTDGEPKDDISGVPAAIQRAEKDQQVIFWAAAARGADIAVLKQFKEPVLLLDEANWSSIFEWLSNSMKKLSSAKPGDQVSINEWQITA
jgi:uncharacterized protein YegL